MLLYQKIKADNDVNGNPRRLYLVYNEVGQVLDAIDIGFEGIMCLPKAGYMPKEMAELPEFDVSVQEYLNCLSIGRDRGSINDADVAEGE